MEMPVPTALLISSNESLIELLRQVIRPIQNLRLDLASEMKEACARVAEGKIVLVLAHLTPGSEVTEVIQLLRLIASNNRQIATLVLTDHYHTEQAGTLLHLGAADYLSHPLDL